MKIRFSFKPDYKMIAVGFPYPGIKKFFLNFWPFIMEVDFEKPKLQPHQGKREIQRRASRLKVIK